jgi:hypothetical protein
MTMQVTTELNQAQQIIYSRSNIRRAFPEFDDTEIAAINLRDDLVIVVRNDGTEQTYDRQLVKTAYQQFTFRLKDFFSYLGPNYRGPSIWHNNAYIMFKGWHYSHALGHLSHSAQIQRSWADKFIHISDQNKLEALLQSDETDIGHLVAPEGFHYIDESYSYDDCDTETEQVDSVKEYPKDPYCSCGSFRRQLNNLSEFQAEIEGYKPWCIHLTWMKRYRQLLVKRGEVRGNNRGQTAQHATAWWYAPPEGKSDKGRFLVLYTKHGSMAPLKAWKTYKPKEIFTQHDVWDLFDNMLDNNFVPFPGTALPQLNNAWKKPAKTTEQNSMSQV